MSIGLTLRFLVLKRDNFTCRYCGRKPPDVVLEVDHITPRALGGKDVIENLATACFECNRGKRDSELPAGMAIDAERLGEDIDPSGQLITVAYDDRSPVLPPDPRDFEFDC